MHKSPLFQHDLIQASIANRGSIAKPLGYIVKLLLLGKVVTSPGNSSPIWRTNHKVLEANHDGLQGLVF
jgi:hypothetical protein